MRKHTLNWVAPVGFASLGNGFSNLSIGSCFLDDALRGLESVPCCEHDISLPAIDGLASDDAGGGCIRGEPIEVGPAHAATRQVKRCGALTSWRCLLLRGRWTHLREVNSGP